MSKNLIILKCMSKKTFISKNMSKINVLPSYISKKKQSSIVYVNTIWSTFRKVNVNNIHILD